VGNRESWTKLFKKSNRMCDIILLICCQREPPVPELLRELHLPHHSHNYALDGIILSTE